MSERCVLCNELFSRPKDKYLIQGRSKENLLFELESLPFNGRFELEQTHLSTLCQCSKETAKFNSAS